jgi:hypothetical protein
VLEAVGWDLHIVTPHALAAALAVAAPPAAGSGIDGARLSTHALFLADVAMFGTLSFVCFVS